MITLLDDTTGATLSGSVSLSDVQNTTSRTLRVTNTGTKPVTSILAYVVNDPDLPAVRTVTLNGVAVTGTSEESAVELLSAPLAVGESITGTDEFSVPPADFREGVDLATLWLGDLEEA